MVNARALKNDKSVVQSAYELLAASTRIECLNKSLKTLENIRDEKPGFRTSRKLSQMDVERYEIGLRSQISSEDWTVRSQAANLGARLGTRNGATIREVALGLAPEAEVEARAAYKEPVFKATVVTIESAREARLERGAATRLQSSREVVSSAVGKFHARQSPGQFADDVRMIMMSTDRLIYELQSELSARGVVSAAEAQSAKESIPGHDKAGTATEKSDDILVKVGVAGLILGPVALAVSSKLPGFEESVSIGNPAGATIAAGLTSMVGGVMAIAAGIDGKYSVREQKAKFDNLDGRIEDMAARIAQHNKVPREADGDLGDAPRSQIERSITKLEGIQKASASLIMGTTEPDIAEAYTKASDVLWKATFRPGLTNQEFSIGRDTLA